MFSFSLILLSLVFHIVNGHTSLKCGSKQHFTDVPARERCEWTPSAPLPFKNAHQICQKWGAVINATNIPSSEQWYWQSCNTKDMNNGCMKIADEYCPKKLCLIRKGNTCRKVSCSSRFKFKCVRRYWYYGGECPKNFFHIANKCYHVSPVRFFNVRDIRNKSHSICRESSGKFNSESLEEHERLALQAYISKQVAYPVVANLEKIFLGNQSLFPGLNIGMRTFPGGSYFFQLLCTSERDYSVSGVRKREKFEYTGSWSENKCRKGFYSYNGYTDFCLKRIDAISPTKAESKCKESNENYLVSIRNSFEQSVVHIIRLHVKTDIYIGIKQISGGIITWSDGSNSTYQNYQPYKDTHTNGECTTMNNKGKWLTSECSKTMTFLCASRINDIRSALSIKGCDATSNRSISINNICYVVSDSSPPPRGYRLSKLRTKEITEHLVNWLNFPVSTEKHICVSNESTYLPWKGAVSILPKLFLNLTYGWLEKSHICKTYLYEKSEIPTTTPPAIPKTTTTPATTNKPLDSLVIALIIAIAVILIFVFVAVGIFICCFCKKTNNAPRSPQPIVPDKNTTHIQMEAPARKTPEPLPKEDDQGIFDDEYEEFPDVDK